MKRLVLLSSILVLLSSCSDDFPKLINSYSVKWEFDLQKEYSTGQFLSWQNPLYSTQLIDASGSILISSYRSTADGTAETILTKLDLNGIKSNDLILSNTNAYSLKVTLSNSNHLALLRTNNVLDTYDTDFNLIESKALDFGDGFQHTLAFGSSSIFRHRHINGVQKLTKFDYQGKVNWEVPYKFVGCGGSTIYILNKGNDISLLAESYPDSIKISYLNSQTGEKYWNKLFMKQTILPNTGNVTGAWNSFGKLVLAAFDVTGSKLLVDIYDGIHKRKLLDIKFSEGSGLVKLLPTQDGGILLGIGSDKSLEASNFKLVKLDREGNPGWIGTFQQVGYDYLADLIELKDGTIVVLSAKGYILGLSPN